MFVTALALLLSSVKYKNFLLRPWKSVVVSRVAAFRSCKYGFPVFFASYFSIYWAFIVFSFAKLFPICVYLNSVFSFFKICSSWWIVKEWTSSICTWSLTRVAWNSPYVLAKVLDGFDLIWDSFWIVRTIRQLIHYFLSEMKRFGNATLSWNLILFITCVSVHTYPAIFENRDFFRFSLLSTRKRRSWHHKHSFSKTIPRMEFCEYHPWFTV